MAIVQDENILYNEKERFYYLSEAGAIKYTGKTHILSLWENPSWRLENMGRLLADDYKRSVYNHRKERYRNVDHIEYNIFLNERGEREAIARALGLFAIAADDYDLDVDVMAGEKMIPHVIQKPLRQAGLYFQGRYSRPVDEDVYQVGY